MRRLLFLVILCLLYASGYSQDNILQMGKYASRLFNNGQVDSAFLVFHQQLQVARKLPDGKYAAYLYAIRAIQHRILDDKAAAVKDVDSAGYFAKHTADKRMKGYVSYSKGWIQSRDEQTTHAVKSFIEALNFLDAAGTNDYKGTIYKELYSIYADWHEYHTQEKYARLNLALANTTLDKQTLFDAYRMMGTAFEYQYRNDRRKPLLDSAYRYYTSALRLFQKNKDQMNFPSDYSHIAINISNLFSEFDPYRQKDSAMLYAQIALDHALKTKQYSFAASAYGVMSEYEKIAGNYAAAKKMLLKAMDYIQEETIPDKNTLADIYINLSQLEEKDGNHALALEYHKQYLSVYRDVYDAEKMESGKRLEAQYETAKKEKQLAIMELNAIRKEQEVSMLKLLDEKNAQQLDFMHLQHERNTQELSLNQQQLSIERIKAQQREQALRAVEEKMAFNRKLLIVYVLLIIACIIALGLLIYAYRQRYKSMLQQGRMHTMEIQRINKDHEITNLSAMLNGQEKERARLARDLHDGLGGLLSGTKIELSGMSYMLDTDEQQSLLRKTLGQIDAAMQELRLVAHNLMPDLLLKHGLGEAVSNYCDRLSSNTLQITAQIIHLKTEPEQGRAVVVYRIIQELVNNAIKHAAASSILVQLQQRDKQLFITVEDDGKGFDMKRADHAWSAGLLNIRSRVEYLKGEIQFNSEINGGTAVEINCPI